MKKKIGRPGSNQAKHKALLTDDIIDAIAVAGNPREAIPRLQEIADMGIDGFVCPFAMDDPISYMRFFSEKIIPQVKGK